MAGSLCSSSANLHFFTTNKLIEHHQPENSFERGSVRHQHHSKSVVKFLGLRSVIISVSNSSKSLGSFLQMWNTLNIQKIVTDILHRCSRRKDSWACCIVFFITRHHNRVTDIRIRKGRIVVRGGQRVYAGWRCVSGKAVVNTRTGKVNSSALRAEARRVVDINRRCVTVSVQRR